MGFIAGWAYRKKITVAGQSGAGADYQVPLKIGDSAGALGVDFDVEGNSDIFPSGKNQGGDLRFTTSDETTLVDFWVENVETVDLANGLQTHFKCNDNASNADIVDSSGNGNDATSTVDTDTMTVTGKINNALEFVPNEHATFDSGIDINSDDYSLSVWFKANSVTGKRPIVGFEGSGNTRLRINDGVLQWAWWDGDTNAYLNSTTSIVTNEINP